MITLVCGKYPIVYHVSCPRDTALYFQRLVRLIHCGITSITLPTSMSRVDVATLVTYVTNYHLTDDLVVNYPDKVLVVAYKLGLTDREMMNHLILHAIDNMSTYQEFVSILRVVEVVEYDQEYNMHDLLARAVITAIDGSWKSAKVKMKHRDMLATHIMNYADAEDIVMLVETLLRQVPTITKPKL